MITEWVWFEGVAREQISSSISCKGWKRSLISNAIVDGRFTRGWAAEKLWEFTDIFRSTDHQTSFGSIQTKSKWVKTKCASPKSTKVCSPCSSLIRKHLSHTCMHVLFIIAWSLGGTVENRVVSRGHRRNSVIYECSSFPWQAHIFQSKDSFSYGSQADRKRTVDLCCVIRVIQL